MGKLHLSIIEENWTGQFQTHEGRPRASPGTCLRSGWQAHTLLPMILRSSCCLECSLLVEMPQTQAQGPPPRMEEQKPKAAQVPMTSWRYHQPWAACLQTSFSMREKGTITFKPNCLDFLWRAAQLSVYSYSTDRFGPA